MSCRHGDCALAYLMKGTNGMYVCIYVGPVGGEKQKCEKQKETKYACAVRAGGRGAAEPQPGRRCTCTRGEEAERTGEYGTVPCTVRSARRSRGASKRKE